MPGFAELIRIGPVEMHHSNGDGTFALLVRNVDTVAETKAVTLDPADPIPIRVHALGDGSYALAVRHA